MDPSPNSVMEWPSWKNQNLKGACDTTFNHNNAKVAAKLQYK